MSGRGCGRWFGFRLSRGGAEVGGNGKMTRNNVTNNSVESVFFPVFVFATLLETIGETATSVDPSPPTEYFFLFPWVVGQFSYHRRA